MCVYADNIMHMSTNPQILFDFIKEKYGPSLARVGFIFIVRWFCHNCDYAIAGKYHASVTNGIANNTIATEHF
jgi:hypothetical protein